MMLQHVIKKNSAIFFGFKRCFLSKNFICADEWKSASMLLSLRNEISLKKLPIYEKNTQNVHSSEFINHELLREILYLRSSEFATSVQEATNQAVVRKLVESGSFRLLVDVLENVMDYGINLDDYSACYILNELIRVKEFKLATQVSKYLQLNSQNALVETLSIYAIYMYLRSKHMTLQLKPLEKESVNEDLCNEDIDGKSFEISIGSTLIKLTSSIDNNIQRNLKTLGFIMCKKYEHALTLLRGNPEIFYKEILEICLYYAQSDEHKNLELTTLIEDFLVSEKNVASSFTSNLDVYVKEIVIKMEPDLIKRQIVSNEEWLNVLKKKLNEKSLGDTKKLRMESVKKIVQHIYLTEKQMWFFQNEDTINLEIESKKQIYPRKWFGKKKKPKQFDDEYIPPAL